MSNQYNSGLIEVDEARIDRLVDDLNEALGEKGPDQSLQEKALLFVLGQNGPLSIDELEDVMHMKRFELVRLLDDCRLKDYVVKYFTGGLMFYRVKDK